MLKYKKYDSGCGCGGDDGSCGSCSSDYELDGGCNGCKLKFSKLFNLQRQCNCGSYDCSYCNQGQQQQSQRRVRSRRRGQSQRNGQSQRSRRSQRSGQSPIRKMKILIIKSSDGKRSKRRSSRKRTFKTLRRSRRLK